MNIDLLITTYEDALLLYDLSDLSKPRLIGKKQIIDKKYNCKTYAYHCMICLLKNKNNIKILLFGRGYTYSTNFTKNIGDTFKEIEIIYNENINNINHINKFNIKIKSVENILIPNSNYKSNWFRFGYNTIVNSKNERIIIMVGGEGNSPNNGKAIGLYNCVTNEMFIKENVCILCNIC